MYQLCVFVAVVIVVVILFFRFDCQTEGEHTNLQLIITNQLVVFMNVIYANDISKHVKSQILMIDMFKARQTHIRHLFKHIQT